MKEAYVSYEIAKLLKEKGFDECIFEFYVGAKIKYARNGEGFKPSELPNICYPHITHQMALAWLREKHFIIVVTPVLFNVNYEHSKWGYDIWADDNLEVSAEDCSNPLNTYEEATETALKYVLENLI